MPTAKKTAPKNKTSEKKVKKEKASENIKKKPEKTVVPEQTSKKAKTVGKAAPSPKEKKETKSKGNKIEKAKSEQPSDTKKDDKVEKVIAAVKTKGKLAAGKNAGEKPATTPASKPTKKPIVAVFTMDNVRDILQNRRDEEREQAEKKEAAAKKAATNVAVAEAPQNRVLGAATLADILGFGAIVKKPDLVNFDETAKRDVPEQHRKYFDMLISLRDRIQKKINQRSRVNKTEDEDIPVAVPAQTDDDDTFDHDFALSLVANEQEALVEINAAIDRIHDGTYGICEITGHPISSERLDAVPFARYSVEGQAQFEMQNRRRSQRTTAFMDSAEDAGIYSGEDADE